MSGNSNRLSGEHNRLPRRGNAMSRVYDRLPAPGNALSGGGYSMSKH